MPQGYKSIRFILRNLMEQNEKIILIKDANIGDTVKLTERRGHNHVLVPVKIVEMNQANETVRVDCNGHQSLWDSDLPCIVRL